MGLNSRCILDLTWIFNVNILSGKLCNRCGWWWFSRSGVSDSCDPMDCSPLGSFVHGILQARILDPPPGDRPNLEIEPASTTSPALAGGFFVFCFFTTSAACETCAEYDFSANRWWIQSITREPFFNFPSHSRFVGIFEIFQVLVLKLHFFLSVSSLFWNDRWHKVKKQFGFLKRRNLAALQVSINLIHNEFTRQVLPQDTISGLTLWCS